MGIYFASSTGISFNFKKVERDFMFHFEMQIFLYELADSQLQAERAWIGWILLLTFLLFSV